MDDNDSSMGAFTMNPTMDEGDFDDNVNATKHRHRNLEKPRSLPNNQNAIDIVARCPNQAHGHQSEYD